MVRTFGHRSGVMVYDSGLRAFIHRKSGRVPGSGGPRSKITSFSSGSRRRMRDRLLTYRWSELVGTRRVLWVTFTARSGSAQSFKSWLSAWRHRFFSFNPGAWFVWRLEYQKRGVAHLHLICVFPSEAMAASAAPRMLTDWLDCASDGDPSLLGQCVRFVRDMNGIACYITDASKVQQAVCPEDESPGRWWGFRFSFRGCDGLVKDCPIRVVQHSLVTGFRRYVLAIRSGRCLRSGREPPSKVVDCAEFFQVGDRFALLLTLSDLGDFDDFVIDAFAN